MERSNYQETRRADIEQDAVEELQRIIGENPGAAFSDVEKAVIFKPASPSTAARMCRR